jgi:hypothetical protein
MGKRRRQAGQRKKSASHNENQGKDQLFDKAFKRILEKASHPAIVRFINGGYEENHDPETPVEFQPTETITKGPDRKMTRRTSDMILTIDGSTYIIEAQTADDDTIAMRIFEYGFTYAVRNAKISGHGAKIEAEMPKAMVIYWETSDKTPDSAVFTLGFKDGKEPREYKVRVLKVLEYTLDDLDRNNMALLYPFYLLKARKEVRQAGTTPERLRELAQETGQTEQDMAHLLEKAHSEGRLSDSDVALVKELMLALHEQVYGGCAPFEEVYMNYDKVLRTPMHDKMARLERKYEEAEQQKQAMLSLFRQGYNADQIEQMLAEGQLNTAENSGSEPLAGG